MTNLVRHNLTSHFNIHDHNLITVQPDLYSIPSYYTPIHFLIPPDIIFFVHSPGLICIKYLTFGLKFTIKIFSSYSMAAFYQ